MTSRWLVTPFYFEHPELALFSAAPDGAATNAPEGIADRCRPSRRGKPARARHHGFIMDSAWRGGGS